MPRPLLPSPGLLDRGSKHLLMQYRLQPHHHLQQQQLQQLQQGMRRKTAIAPGLPRRAVQLQQVTEMSVFSYNTACRQHNESGSKGRGGSHTLKALPRERPQPAAAGGAAGGGAAAAAAGGAAAYGELPPIGFPATVAAAQVVRDMGRDGACRRPAQPAAASCNFAGPALEGSGLGAELLAPGNPWAQGLPRGVLAGTPTARG